MVRLVGRGRIKDKAGGKNAPQAGFACVLKWCDPTT